VLGLLAGLALFHPQTPCRLACATENKAAENKAAENKAAEAVAALVAAADVPDELRVAMLATLAPPGVGGNEAARGRLVRQWSGSTKPAATAPAASAPAASADEWLFGLAARPLPEGQLRNRATPVLLSTAQAVAIQEMLSARAVLDAYAPHGLTDLAALRQALLLAAGELRVTGRVQGTWHQADVRGEFAASFVAGRRKALTAFLLDPPALSLVRNAYRDILTSRTRELTQGKSWDDALALVTHLESLRLATGPLLLDAARCHEARGVADQALAALRQARQVEDPRASVEFLAELGDIALRLGGDDAQVVAEEAFTEALRRLRNR